MADLDLESLLDRIVHPRHGIVKSIYELARQHDCPELFVSNVEFVNARRLRQPPSNLPAHTSISSGAGITREAAIWAAVGEAIERYCGSLYFTDDLTIATERDLGDAALDLKRYVLFDDDQYDEPNFPYARPDCDAPRRWAIARSLLDNNARYIPAQMIWLGYDLMSKEEYLAQSMSTGLGAGESFERAALTALREVLERDAFTCHWLGGQAGTILPPSTIADLPLPDAVMRLWESRHGRLQLSLLSNEFGVPVVVGMISECVSGAIAVGAACHDDLAFAVEKAIIEAWHTRSFALELESSHRKQARLVRDAVTTLDRHILFYRDPVNCDEPRRLLGGKHGPVPARRPFHGNLAVALHDMALRLARHGYEAFAVDVTTSDVADLGMHVVRVVVPGLQPLYSGVGSLSRTRLRLNKYDSFWQNSQPSAINMAPHPFP